MNTELFKKIHDIISADPDKLGMSSWENFDPGCGTTRCVSGWAVCLTTGTSLYDLADEVHPEVKKLARDHGALTSGGYSIDFQKLGASLLGLSEYESNAFYLDDDPALEFVRLASEGDREGARRYLEEHLDEEYA
jgi:hypothetical protein